MSSVRLFNILLLTYIVAPIDFPGNKSELEELHGTTDLR